LAETAAERAHVADLRAGDLGGCARECRERGEQFALGDLGELHARSDGDTHGHGTRRAERANLAERTTQSREADDAVRLRDVLFLKVEQVGAAGEQFGLAPLIVKERQGRGDRGRLVVGEVFHYFFPPFARASRTRLGVSGRNGTRTPRALNTALPTAA